MLSPQTKIFFITLLYLLIIPKLDAQSNDLLVEKIGIETGLSSNYPNCVIQDSNGFIWIGTNNGLNRYDGYKSKVFKYDALDVNTISDNWISCLLEDSNGNIWIGTNGGGLNQYNTTTGDITRYRHKKDDSTTISSDNVLKLYQDNKSRIWVGTKNGLNLVDVTKQTIKHWLQPNACEKCDYSIKGLTGDEKGNIWIGDEFNGLYYFTPSNGKFTKPHLEYSGENKLPSEFINDLNYSKGKLWVATDNGLAILNTISKVYENIPIEISSKSIAKEVYIWEIYNDNDNDIWLCTNGSGLIHYKLDTKEVTIYNSEENADYKINSNFVANVLIDKSKNIWIATRGNGLNKFNLKNLIFDHWEKETDNSLVSNDVRAMLQEADGTIWIGTNNGLSQFNIKTNLFRNYIKDFTYKADVNTPKIRSIYRSKNNILYIGTQNGGLYQYNKKLDEFKLASNFENSYQPTTIGHIENIVYEPEKGVLWLGTVGTGLVSYNTNTNDLKRIYSKNNENDILLSLTVICMLEASNSEIWIGSDRGLILLNTKTLEYKLWDYKEGCEDCIIGNKIRSLYLDGDNKLWIGTRSGLSIFDLESEKFENYVIKDGLPSDIIFGILSGVDGNFWLTTPNGLSRVNPLNMEFKNIRIPKNNVLDMGGHSQGLDGTLLVGGTSGFTMFHPNDIKDNTYLPEVVFTDIKVDNQSTTFDKNTSKLKSIDLNYDQNDLIFEFSALEFTNSKTNKYQYFLEGFNDDWVQYGNKHDVTFTNLEPKTYTLKIKGSNNEGVWNEKETSLIINIKPPWWKTIWFRILSILLIIGFVFIVYNLRVKGLKTRQALLQKEVSKQTTELLENNKKLETLHKEKDGILDVIAHDLRGPLNNIYGLTQLLEDNDNLDSEQKSYIGYINESVKIGNSLITDLLFTSNIKQLDKKIKFENFDLVKFIEEWEKAYVTRLEKKDQKLRKYISKDLPKLYADKKLVMRIFDNIMTNAIKFSNKGNMIDLLVNSNNRNIIISFKDYGPGMSEADKEKAFGMFQKLSAQPTDGESSNGLGLAIVKSLVEKLEGSIKIESELGQGTEFIISLLQEKNTIT